VGCSVRYVKSRRLGFANLRSKEQENANERQ
jgi:hypothetical protein